MSYFLSHPDKFYHQHIQEVLRNTINIINELGDFKSKDDIKLLSIIVAFCHDLGKLTSFFQKHIRNERVNHDLKQHSLLSAIFSAYIINKLKPNEPYFPTIAYLSISKHHGNLENPYNVIKILKTDPYIASIIKKQIDDIRKNRKEVLEELRKIQEIDDEYTKEIIIKCIELFVEFLYQTDQVNETYKILRLPLEKNPKITLYTQLIFSILIASDKFSASETERPLRKKLNSIDNYIRSLNKGDEISRMRMEFYESVIKKLESLSLEEIIRNPISITAPTGMGKTLTAIECAIRIRKKIENEKGYTPRIIYTLPLINIIEQNYEMIKNAILGENNEDNTIILKHHYLSDISYKESGEELPLEQSQQLISSWESEIIVSTFVQLFHTIVGYKNKFLKKFYNIVGSILILDELQSLPVEYWNLAREILKLLQDELNVIVIQMTATKPSIFENTIELFENNKKFFIKQNRTTLHYEGEIEFDEWIERVMNLYEDHKSLLVVLNTISKSIETYNKLKEGIASENLFYLSTNIIPLHRKERIEDVKNKLKNGERVILVSTQVVEAGIDLDFPAVIRDIGPIDSIVQVAGRCNREGKRIKGNVYVFNLKDGGCSNVYGAVAYTVSDDILKSGNEIEESKYYELIEEYFKLVRERRGFSLDVWEAYCLMNFSNFSEIEKMEFGLESSLADFSLIKNKPEVPIFISLNEEDDEFFEKFIEEVINEKDMRKRKIAFMRYRKCLYDHIVRPLIARVQNNLPAIVSSDDGKKFNLFWVKSNQKNYYYNDETGYIWNQKTAFII